MKLKISELRNLISEGVEKIKESFETGPDDEVDLGDPTIVHSNKYDFDDQETFTKMQNGRIRLDPGDFGDKRDKELEAFGIKEEKDFEEVAPPGWEDRVKKLKHNKHIDNPWALAWSIYDKGDRLHKKKK